MDEYFKLIRQVLQESRSKGEGVYYEAHHIIPKSFSKKSSTILLTPEEHYLAHKYLAEYWKNHSTYGKKMLWAFHRLAYDKGRKLTKEQYGEARRILQPLWKADKTLKHREKISLAMKGNTNNSSRVFKGMESSITEEGRRELSNAISERNKGKKLASKGPYTYTATLGQIITEMSFQDISNKVNIPYATLQHRFNKNKGKIIKGWKIE
jgi:hypothetical protein